MVSYIHSKFVAGLIISLISCLIISGCSSKKSTTRLHKELSKQDPSHLKYRGTYKVGKEYAINNVKYTPKVDHHYDKVGIACWYGGKDNFHGKRTANGDIFEKNVLSAAHRTLPLPSLVKVTNLNNRKSLIVRVNDRGPYVKGRIIDVSEQAAKILDFRKQGLAKVRIQYLHKETQEFLKNIKLTNNNKSRPRKSKYHNCSVNCHVKLVNMKYKLAVNP